MALRALFQSPFLAQWIKRCGKGKSVPSLRLKVAQTGGFLDTLIILIIFQQISYATVSLVDEHEYFEVLIEGR